MDLYPNLPGITYSKTRLANAGSTIVQQSVSGKEVRFMLRSRPIWGYRLIYSVMRGNRGYNVTMRGQWDNMGQVTETGQLINSATLVTNELSVLEGFFVRQHGAYAQFLLDDPSDNTVGLQQFAIGDGSRTSWATPYSTGWASQFGAGPNYGGAGFYTDNSPYGVRAVNSFAALFSPPAGGFTSSGLVTLPVAPAPGQPLYVTSQGASQTTGPLLGEVFATADGLSTSYQLTRQIGSNQFMTGYAEPVQELNGTPLIWDQGVQTTNFTVGANGLITFGYTPAANHVLSWAGKFYYVVRFKQDETEFEEFLFRLYRAKQVELVEVLQ